MSKALLLLRVLAPVFIISIAVMFCIIMLSGIEQEMIWVLVSVSALGSLISLFLLLWGFMASNMLQDLFRATHSDYSEQNVFR